MTDPQQNSSQRLIVRVYYEDTDFSGRVYHASYLRFFERGRTEWLRARGFEQRAMAERDAIAFVVHRLEIDFLKPAVMDDLLSVETEAANVRAASIAFSQRIVRDSQVLCSALVSVAALRGGRPVRLPADIRARLCEPPAR